MQRFAARVAALTQRLGKALGPLASGALAALVEVLKIGREMLVIPIQVLAAIGELIGAVVLAGWRRVWPVGVRAYALARDAVWWGRIHVRPRHGALAACVLAAVALIGSQFLDYRGVSVGAAGYSGVETVAPPPEIDRELAGNAHAWVMIPIALVALAALYTAVRGRWRAARALLPLGLVVVAITLLADAPKGLDESVTAVAYEGAEAELLAGFWAQLAAGVVLALSGPLLSATLRPSGSGRGVRRTAGRRVRSSPVADPSIGVVDG